MRTPKESFSWKHLSENPYLWWLYVLEPLVKVSYSVHWKSKVCFVGTTSEIDGFRDSFLVRKMHGCYWNTQKFRWTFHSYLSDTRRLQCADDVFSSVFTLYILIQIAWYCKSIIILLTNNLTNICSKINKTPLILWMVYTWNVKAKMMGLE